MLNTYLAQTQALLQNPPANNLLYTTANLTTFINTARGQLAGETACVRSMGTLSLSTGTRVYPFNAISLASGASVSGVFNVRQAFLSVGGGQQLLTPRSFEWFSAYALNRVVPENGYPKIFSVYGPGANGLIYVDPIPPSGLTMTLDCACIPEDLVDDTTPEAIPVLFTGAVQYFAAYLALMSAQRYGDAQAMYQLYGVFVQRARGAVTPGVLPSIYPQIPDPTVQNKLGSQAAPQGSAQ